MRRLLHRRLDQRRCRQHLLLAAHLALGLLREPLLLRLAPRLALRHEQLLLSLLERGGLLAAHVLGLLRGGALLLVLQVLQQRSHHHLSFSLRLLLLARLQRRLRAQRRRFLLRQVVDERLVDLVLLERARPRVLAGLHGYSLARSPLDHAPAHHAGTVTVASAVERHAEIRRDLRVANLQVGASRRRPLPPHTLWHGSRLKAQPGDRLLPLPYRKAKLFLGEL